MITSKITNLFMKSAYVSYESRVFSIYSPPPPEKTISACISYYNSTYFQKPWSSLSLRFQFIPN